jgi:hypothetical protein
MPTEAIGQTRKKLHGQAAAHTANNTAARAKYNEPTRAFLTTGIRTNE